MTTYDDSPEPGALLWLVIITVVIIVLTVLYHFLM